MSLFGLKKQKISSQRSSTDNRRKQKFAIWDYYKKKNESASTGRGKTKK